MTEVGTHVLLAHLRRIEHHHKLARLTAQTAGEAGRQPVEPPPEAGGAPAPKGGPDHV